MKWFISKKAFPHKHLTTTKSAGNMKDEIARKTFLCSLKLNPADLVLANQVHGNNVKVVSSSDKNTFIDNCDGLISVEEDIVLGIFTADCIPLLISAENRRLKAAIHLGWRGLCNGIIENAVEILKNEFRTELKKVNVYIGPHIRSCCCEITSEVRNKFNVGLNGNRLDMSEIVYNKLKKFGIVNIADVKLCTFHEDHLFFSYRRTHCGERIISLIA